MRARTSHKSDKRQDIILVKKFDNRCLFVTDTLMIEYDGEVANCGVSHKLSSKAADRFWAMVDAAKVKMQADGNISARNPVFLLSSAQNFCFANALPKIIGRGGLVQRLHSAPIVSAGGSGK